MPSTFNTVVLGVLAFVCLCVSRVMAEPVAATPPLNTQLEALKNTSLELNKNLLLLEEDLLFPASTQVGVYLSMDTGQFFELDSVKLTIDDQLVASHLYTHQQTQALHRGGVQRLHLGNLKKGQHEITAIFVGRGPDKSEYKRGATYSYFKDEKAGVLELRIRDESRTLQPTFEIKEWSLQAP